MTPLKDCHVVDALFPGIGCISSYDQSVITHEGYLTFPYFGKSKRSSSGFCEKCNFKGIWVQINADTGPTKVN